MARLSRLVGRGRALEILLVADDLDGPRAEQYGYVNRLIADDQRSSRCAKSRKLLNRLGFGGREGNSNPRLPRCEPGK
jgi:enoyl-CoA hydratase/carnithine racemase